MKEKKFHYRKALISARLNWQLYLFVLPGILYVIIFQILPLYGIQIAFRDYRIAFGIRGSEWVGFKHFYTFFDSYYWKRLFTNTFILNLIGLIFSSTIPVILALTLNCLKNEKAKHTIQTIVYVPHFISTVVLTGLIYIFFSPTNGFVNRVIESLNGTPIYFLMEKRWFRALYIGSDVWQNSGWNSILYIAALASVDTGLYEAARIDGATRLQTIRYIDIPATVQVFTMMLILNCGHLLSSNTEKVLLLQTDGNSAVSDVFGTYVYNFGIGKAQFSYTTAIGLMLNVISFVMVFGVNSISRSLDGAELF